MASTTLTCAKDTWLVRRLSDSADMGAGNDHHLGVGLLSGGNYLARFELKLNMPDWTGLGITKITSCTLKLRARSAHSSIGGTPRFYLRRLTAAFTEGTHGGQGGGDPASETWSSSNAEVYPGSANTATGEIDTGALGSVSAGDVVSVDITPFLEKWAPATVLKSDGVTPCEGVTNNGIVTISFDTGSSSRYIEFDSQEGGTSPYATLVYVANLAPSPPVFDEIDNLSYTAGVSVLDTTPQVELHGVDSDDTVVTAYDWLLVDTTTSTTIEGLTGLTSGITGMNIVRSPAVALTAGHSFSLGVRTKDPAGTYGPWSYASFAVSAAPTAALTNPASTGIVGQLTMQTGWTSPRFVVGHSYSDPAGLAQAEYEYRLYADTAGVQGSQVYTTGAIAGAGTGPFTLAHNLTNGTYYWIAVLAKNSSGVWSTVSTARRVRARWASAAYYMDTGITPPTLTGWSFAAQSTPGSGSVYVEYGSNTSTTAPGAYFSSLGLVTVQRYFHYRVWLMAWGSASPTSPTFDQATLTYFQGTASIDGWYLGGGCSVDSSEFVFGTQALRIDGVVSNPGRAAWQGRVGPPYNQVPIEVQPNTWYTLHGRIKNQGTTDATIAAYTPDGGTQLTYAWMPTDTDGEWVHVKSDPWYSGANTSIAALCWMDGAAGTIAWFDALKLEASLVATPWTPGFVGKGVAIDAGGVQVSAQDGAVFRLIGSAAGAQDYVELGPRGLHAALWMIRDTAAPSGNPPAGQHGLWYDSAGSVLKVRDSVGGDVSLGGSGAPTTADYLVGTAQAGLSAEIVVGTTPGGELGGTWASPTVDTTHSGSPHSNYIANALVTTRGDLIYRNATVPDRLAIGTARKALMSNGTDPLWDWPTRGFMPYAYPVGLPLDVVSGSASTLSAVSGSNAGAGACAFYLTAPMAIQSVTVRNGDTATARSAEFRLYYDDGTSSLQFVTGTDGTLSFTPSAVSDRTGNVSSPGTVLPPGLYWLVLRVTNAQSFLWRRVALTELAGNGYIQQTAASVTALGSTINITSWTAGPFQYLARLNGRVFGQAAAF